MIQTQEENILFFENLRAGTIKKAMDIQLMFPEDASLPYIAPKMVWKFKDIISYLARDFLHVEIGLKAVPELLKKYNSTEAEYLARSKFSQYIATYFESFKDKYRILKLDGLLAYISTELTGDGNAIYLKENDKILLSQTYDFINNDITQFQFVTLSGEFILDVHAQRISLRAHRDKSIAQLH